METQRAVLSKEKIKDRFTKKFIIYIIEILLLAILIIISLSFGSVKYSFKDIISVFTKQADITVKTIVLDIRMPRTILAMLVGSNLAISGALLQSVLKNPLAAPGVIGVTAGSSLAAITIMLAFPTLTYLVPFAAFFGGVMATSLVFVLAWKQKLSAVRIVLAGVAINAVLGGGTSMLSILYSDRIQGILMWVNGSLAGKTWNQVEALLPYTFIGLIIAFLQTNTANVLRLGEETAVSLGVKVNLARIILSITAAFLTAISVSIVGLIGFIGLVIPHISRLLVGSDYRFMLPSSAILGSILLVLADMIARTAFSPVELPVGIIMAIVGGPFFLYLLRRVGRYGS